MNGPEVMYCARSNADADNCETPSAECSNRLEPSGQRRTAKRILVVDDNKFLSNAICSALKRAGLETAEAPDGRVGLKLHSEGKFDLIITDIIMPEIDGVELISALRKKDPSLSIIAMSGGGLMRPHDYLQIAISLGVESVLCKPFTLCDLIALVTREINRHTALAGDSWQPTKTMELIE
jgi:DNA-binding response OmpR family regulator